MKAFLTAIAMTIAVPAAAQTADPAHSAHSSAPAPAPAADGKADAGHNDHAGCCEKMTDGKAMPCCDKAKTGGQKMDCCQKKAGSKAADPHAGHDMSKADPHAGHKMGNH